MHGPNLPTAAPGLEGPQHRPSLPGFADALGDRVLVFETSNSSWLELLRFKRALSEVPAFESALRQRLDDLSGFSHPSIAAIRRVERDAGDDLMLVWNHVAGRRLSEIMQDATGPAFALELIGQVAPALVALHEHEAGLSHGLLTPDRIVVTRDGRLVITEHLMASAMGVLGLPAERVRAELQLAVADGPDPVMFGSAADLLQLGFMALSLLVGRRIDPTEYPAKMGACLEELEARAAGRFMVPASLRSWLEHALQLDGKSFMSAREALDAFSGLPTAAELLTPVKPAPAPVEAPASAAVVTTPATPVALPPPDSVVAPATSVMEPVLAATGHAAASTTAEAIAPPVAAAKPRMGPMAVSPAPAAVSAAPSLASFPVQPSAPTSAAPVKSRRRLIVTVAIAVVLGGVAIFEGSVIAMLIDRPASLPPPAIDRAAHAPAPAALSVPEPSPTSGPASPAATTASAAAIPATAAAADPTAANALRPGADPSLAGAPGSRFGGLKLTSSFDLAAFENGKPVGSSAAPIALTEGSHAMDLVNDALGFRTRITVTVKPGQMTSVALSAPNGRVSINAMPWASVWIDGAPAGDTPLANVAIPIGSHEVVFRHPQLGEQRQTMIVKAEGLTKVSANLQATAGGER
ncbi:MAG: PEGA domain-containing protein [Vicinamibacterales bacterium]